MFCGSHFILVFVMNMRTTDTFPLFPLLLKCQHLGDRAQAFAFKQKKRKILCTKVKALNVGKLVVIKMDY